MKMGPLQNFRFSEAPNLIGALNIDMLILKCAACKRKLWRYDKLGQGEVLRCHWKRIEKVYTLERDGNRIKCACGKDIGLDKGSFIKMVSKAFTYTGTKRNV